MLILECSMFKASRVSYGIFQGCIRHTSILREGDKMCSVKPHIASCWIYSRADFACFHVVGCVICVWIAAKHACGTSDLSTAVESQTLEQTAKLILQHD